jgi:hypothetical protein
MTMIERIKIPVIIMGFFLILLPSYATAQSREQTDSLAAYYQEYFMQLIEEWRLEKVQEFAQQWNVNVVGGKEVGLNRAFWEERFNLSLSLGLPSARMSQQLILEYRVKPKLLLRGEISRQTSRNDAWLDFIFRTEY